MINMTGKISCIVITKNSEKHINKCLSSIIKQTYVDFEIIVVDSESTDGTNIIIDTWSNFSPKLKKIVLPSNTTIGRARQVGLEHANGSIIAWIDSDVELPHNNWLNNMVKPMLEGYKNTNKDTIDGVQTLSKTKVNDPWILKHLHSGFEYKYDILDTEHYQIVGTGHTLMWKHIIEEVGGIKDIQSAEDIDLTKRMMQAGYKFIYLPSEKVYHYHVDGWISYFKKHIIRNKIYALRRIFLERTKI